MSGGFTNKPKILRGAFVELGLSIPPLVVIFQYNPVQLSRTRSISYSVPGKETRESRNRAAGRTREEEYWLPLREFHGREEYVDPFLLQKEQQVAVQEENISFEIRLDATDKLNEGDALTEQFGIAPQLATLELMVHPKSESLLGAAVDALLGLGSEGFSFTKSTNPPMILFIWGLKRVLPVNINSMSITETEFSTNLDPIRATVAISMTVIEGKNPPYMYSKAMKEVMSVLNLANIGDVANVVIPG